MTTAHEAALAALTWALSDLLAEEPPALSAGAKNLVTEARRLTGYQPPRPESMLRSVFNPQQYFRPEALSQAAPSPMTTAGAVDPNPLRDGLKADRDVFKSPDVDQALFLLDKWAWAVPAGERSFAEQARLTAAVAAILANWQEDGPARVALVGADIPGIQRFIYTISAKGALKSLRARSFYVELLAEEAARRLLKALGLSRANLLYTAGGHLYLLVPATDEARLRIAQEVAAFNEALEKESGGQLYLAHGITDGVDVGVLAEPEGARLWEQVRHAISTTRQQRYQRLIRGERFWEAQEPKLEACQVCRRESDKLEELTRPEPGEPPTMACSFCKGLYDLGDKLPDARAIVPTEGGPFSVAGATYGVRCSVPSRGPAYIISSVEPADFAEPGRVPVWLTTYAARAEKKMATFEHLARASTGAKLLGVLRMDVDNLGKTFGAGRDLLQTMMLSRALTRFFKFHLEALCKGEGAAEPVLLPPPEGGWQVVVLYAGGDDLFLVGAWDQLAELAFQVRRAFQAYTGGQLTMSGGLLAAEHKLPIHHLAKEAEEAEKAAKKLAEPQAKMPGVCKKGKKEKDAIALLYPGPHRYDNEKERLKKPERAVWSAMPWSRAEEMLREVVRPVVLPCLPSDGQRPGRVVPRLPRSLIFRLLNLANTRLLHGPLYLPQMAYAFARVEKKVKDLPEWAAIKAYLWVMEGQKPTLEGDWEQNRMAYLPAMLRWIDLLSRGGYDDGSETETATDR